MCPHGLSCHKGLNCPKLHSMTDKALFLKNGGQGIPVHNKAYLSLRLMERFSFATPSCARMPNARRDMPTTNAWAIRPCSEIPTVDTHTGKKKRTFCLKTLVILMMPTACAPFVAAWDTLANSVLFAIKCCLNTSSTLDSWSNGIKALK